MGATRSAPTASRSISCPARSLPCGARRTSGSTKRIPVGAGLGGGSADAAAVLRWAGCDDLVLAASLGADVPFCLVGGRRPGDGHRRDRRAAAVRGARAHAAHPAALDRHLGGLPPVGRAGWAHRPTARTTSSRPRSRSSRALAGWRDRLGDATGQDAATGGQRVDVVRRWRVPGRDRGGRRREPTAPEGGRAVLPGPTCRPGAASACAFSIFLCFFLRMRLRRFLIRDPMAGRQGSWTGERLPRPPVLRWGARQLWRVVQQAERLTLDQEVAGSSPAPPARRSAGQRVGGREGSCRTARRVAKCVAMSRFTHRADPRRCAGIHGVDQPGPRGERRSRRGAGRRGRLRLTNTSELVDAGRGRSGHVHRVTKCPLLR